MSSIPQPPPQSHLPLSSATFQIVPDEEAAPSDTHSLQFRDCVELSDPGSGGVPYKTQTPFNGVSWIQVDKYSKYFNVTTEEVRHRVISVMRLEDSFLEELAGRIDLYGPIWSALTLAIGIFVFGSVGNFLPHPGRGTNLQELSSVVSFVLFYLGMVGGGGWAILRYVGAESIILSELTCLLGYSLILFYPAIILSSLRIWILNWISCLVCVGASGYFVYKNLHPVLRTSSIGIEKAYFYSVVLVFVHSLFLLLIKLIYL